VTETAGEQKGGRRDARRNHERLVAAAREVFAEQGVEASLEEIARRAGLGIGTLYRHFGTREALVEAIFERRIGELVAVAEAAAADPDGWRALGDLLEQTLELQAGDRVLKAVLLRYPPGVGRLERAREELRSLFEQVLEHAREQGTLRRDFALADLALLFWSFDGLRAETATAQVESPLTDAELLAAMNALREQRVGRRQPPSRREPP
jgi:AcrR family transcriptional regulator